ncbi:hypothetical protein VCSRO12_1148 [Vibrio cholerae]|nr:hypothetical protein VCSRO119_3114 [Vibrio cholerae]GHY61504.1 hypothetical protein VCSRO12_1148 [Vibrio cholerae]GIA62308.1 hypothetical protein VCSRO87_3101 [Vibrio cholerae]
MQSNVLLRYDFKGIFIDAKLALSKIWLTRQSDMFDRYAWI